MTWYLLNVSGQYYLFSPASNFYFTAGLTGGTPTNIQIVFPQWGGAYGQSFPITLAQVEEIVGTIPQPL